MAFGAPQCRALMFVALLFVALLFCCACSSIAAQSDAAAAERSVVGLYETIRRVAFPASPDLGAGKVKADGRFILLMPGKILNFHDYHPGVKYQEETLKEDEDTKFAIVPPLTMEKWFDLADVIPSANPLSGQDTGRSLANIYRSILTQMTIKNLQKQGDAIQRLYNQAIGYLNEVVPHPEDLSKNTTRLALYNEFKEQYNEQRLEMEKIILDKQQEMESTKYQLWFQRSYPSLLAKVESAYVRWLIFGRKELCDIYITYLDTGSSAKILEEARVVMRAAGVTSLDRTRTVYPVSFEPSDWYRYLLPTNIKKPSRTELQETLGRISARINTMRGTINFYSRDNPTFDNYTKLLTSRQNKQARSRDQTLTNYLRNELECTVRKMGVEVGNGGDPCQDMATLSQKLANVSAGEADAIASTGGFNWGNSSKKAYINSLWDKIRDLENKKHKVEDALTDADPLVGGVLNADPITIAGIRDAQADENWLEFQFNSEKYKSSSSYSSSYSQYSSSSRVGGWLFSGGHSHSSSTSRSSYAADMSQSAMNVKGKLLRVHIKRPWFKPEVFDDRNLEFIANTESGGTLLGSPGKIGSETDFINEISGNANIMYQLPEYVTSFLLARDIEMEFSNIKSKTISDTVSSFTHTSARASFLFFSASFSSSSSNYKSRSSVHRTANGMTIKMPGAQIIGYYTQILPKFPARGP